MAGYSSYGTDWGVDQILGQAHLLGSITKIQHYQENIRSHFGIACLYTVKLLCEFLNYGSGFLDYLEAVDPISSPLYTEI